MIVKNSIVELEITDISSDGNGVGRYEGMAIFVPQTAIGDKLLVKIVCVKKNYAYGIIDTIIVPSNDRIGVDCDVFGKCGGCSYRHISYKSELLVKDNIVKDAFTRIGKLNPAFTPILACNETENYRNKAQYPVAEVDGKAVCGFYSKRSHRVVPFTACKIQPCEFEKIVARIIDYVNDKNISVYNEQTNKGTLRHIYLRKGCYTHETMVCLVATRNISEEISDLCEMLVSEFLNIKSIVVNVNDKNTNAILGNKNYIACGMPYISDIMCGNKVLLSPNSFYQVNTKQAEKLYGIAKKFANITSDDTLLDLYCGAGTIGLSMAKHLKNLIGVDDVPQAIKNAEENAKLNSIDNAKFYCSDAGEFAENMLKQNKKIDVVIVNPPRKGCDMLTLNSISQIAPSRVVMVSCNPSTAARDCAILNTLGYKVEKVSPVDMFPRTVHVETVVQLVRKKPDTYIDITVDMDELDLTSSEAKATYDEIKDYVFEGFGLKVSSLNIAQVKTKCGIIERENYNKPKSENVKQPQCTKDKEEAIMNALRHFKMI